MKLRINVLQEHIDKGICHDPRNCAIANAIKEIFPEARIFDSCIYVNMKHMENHRIRIIHSSQEWQMNPSNITLPHFVKENIWEFDRGHSIEPFSFEIPITDEMLELVNLESALADIDHLEIVEADV